MSIVRSYVRQPVGMDAVVASSLRRRTHTNGPWPTGPPVRPGKQEDVSGTLHRLPMSVVRIIFRELDGTPVIIFKTAPLLTWGFVRHQGLEPRTR